MKRFTEKTNCSYRFNGDLYVKGDCNRFNEAMDRLGEYEETGLDPSQIADISRTLADLKAEAAEMEEAADLWEKIALQLVDKLNEHKEKLIDGRIVELPCKVGDNAYVIEVAPKGEGLCYEIKKVEVVKYIQDRFRLIVEFRTAPHKFQQLCSEYVYRTTEEAEQALKESEGRNEQRTEKET